MPGAGPEAGSQEHKDTGELITPPDVVVEGEPRVETTGEREAARPQSGFPGPQMPEEPAQPPQTPSSVVRQTKEPKPILPAGFDPKKLKQSADTLKETQKDARKASTLEDILNSLNF